MCDHVVELVEYILMVSGRDLPSLASVHCAHGCLRQATCLHQRRRNILIDCPSFWTWYGLLVQTFSSVFEDQTS